MAFTTWDSATSFNAAVSNGGLTLTNASGSSIRAFGAQNSGKWYWEITVTNTAGTPAFGVVTNGRTQPENLAYYNTLSYLSLCQWGGSIHVHGSTSLTSNGTSIAVSMGAFAVNDTMCIALDLDRGQIWFRRNGGNWNNNAARDPATGAGGIDLSNMGRGPAAYFYPAAGSNTGSGVSNANFGQNAFAYAVPTGFAGYETATPASYAAATRLGTETWLTADPPVRATRIGREVWWDSNATPEVPVEPARRRSIIVSG